MENGEHKIRTQDILNVFENILNGKMTLNEADLWASRIIKLHDDGVLELVTDYHSRDWGAIMYLFGVDIQTAPGVYLHSLEDIRDAMLRYFPKK